MSGEPPRVNAVDPEISDQDAEEERYGILLRLAARMFPSPVSDFFLRLFASVEAGYDRWMGEPECLWFGCDHGHVWGMQFPHGRSRSYYFALSQQDPDRPVRIFAYTSEGRWTLSRLQEGEGDGVVKLQGQPFPQPQELAAMDASSDSYLFTVACCILVAAYTGDRISFQLGSLADREATSRLDGRS